MSKIEVALQVLAMAAGAGQRTATAQGINVVSEELAKEASSVVLAFLKSDKSEARE